MPKRSPNPVPRVLPRVAVVTSAYNASITHALRDGAARAYAARGGSARAIVHADAPGAYELPVLCMAAATSGEFDGVVALGCIIKGETMHDRVIADAVAQGLTHVSLATGVPVALGVLTVDTPEQARDRAGGRHGNKGEEAMNALLDTLAAMGPLSEGKSAATGLHAKPDKARVAGGKRGGRG